MPDVSLTATVAGGVASYLLGVLWYGPVFGARRRALTGTPADAASPRSPEHAVIFGLGLVAAYVFGLFIGPRPPVPLAVGAGVAAGSCWVMTSLAISQTLERRPLELLLIDGVFHTLRFALIGLAFGLVG